MKTFSESFSPRQRTAFRLAFSIAVALGMLRFVCGFGIMTAPFVIWNPLYFFLGILLSFGIILVAIQGVVITLLQFRSFTRVVILRETLIWMMVGGLSFFSHFPNPELSGIAVRGMMWSSLLSEFESGGHPRMIGRSPRWILNTKYSQGEVVSLDWGGALIGSWGFLIVRGDVDRMIVEAEHANDVIWFRDRVCAFTKND